MTVEFKEFISALIYFLLLPVVLILWLPTFGHSTEWFGRLGYILALWAR